MSGRGRRASGRAGRFARRSVVAAACAALLASGCGAPWPEEATARPVARQPALAPDPAEATVPPNLAPLNFRVREPGARFAVAVRGARGGECRLRCRGSDCRWDPRTWRRLLETNRGASLQLEVFVRDQGGTWSAFRPVRLHVAEEPVDACLVYRLLVPNTQKAVIHGIFERSLESFATRRLLAPLEGAAQCFNCHTFHAHDPRRSFFHVRGRQGGTVLLMDGQVRKVDTQCQPLYRPLTYACWHPDGRHIVGSINEFAGIFTAVEAGYYSHTVDVRGDLLLFDTATDELSSSPAVYGPEYVETHPCFAPDGRWLYYARARSQPLRTQHDLQQFRADLLRVACDVNSGRWGEPELVLACAAHGRSAAFPQVSPCGRYVLHVQSERGTYPITEPTADLYLLDLHTGASRPLERLNSPRSESNPRWSANGRWIVFLSNRGDGRSALPYLAYFAADGQTGAPIVLPQEDPAFYDTFTDTYNAVELVSGPVPLSAYRLGRALQAPASQARLAAGVALDAVSRATVALQHPQGAYRSH